MTNRGSLWGALTRVIERSGPRFSQIIEMEGSSVSMQSFRTTVFHSSENACPKLWGPKKIAKFGEKFPQNSGKGPP